jgi:hypothetical protein
MRIQQLIEAPVNPGDRKEIELKTAVPAFKVNSETEIPDALLRLLKGIEKNCSEIMKIYHNLNKSDSHGSSFLYRGVSSSKDAIFGKPFENRKPKDSNALLSKYLNRLMEIEGFEARRDNSIFAVSHRGHASQYANPDIYIIFPVDGFKFTWSPKEEDLVLNVQTISKFFSVSKVGQLKKAIADQWDQAKEFFDHYNYAGAGSLEHFKVRAFTRSGAIREDISALTQAILGNVLPEEFHQYTDMTKLLNDGLVLDHFEFDNTDLVGAIEARHEVYIRGAYYGINVNFANLVKEYLTRKQS